MKNAIKLTFLALFFVSFSVAFANAQGGNSPTKTTNKILYHNGPVRIGSQDVYFIYYGCWGTSQCGFAGENTTMMILSDFMSSVGNTPYMWINTTYPDGTGQSPNGVVIYGGSAVDNSYSHGVDLTESDIVAILTDHIGIWGSPDLPHDPDGIYVVMASADIASGATGACTTGAPPFHGHAIIDGAPVPYVFLLNPNRCPTIGGGQYFTTDSTGYVTPNGNFAGDAMVLNLTHALNGLLTDPYRDGWYDRYGLENADKCTGTFGQTYAAANGARANIHLGVRDFLLEQNWVNGRKGYCANYFLP